MRSSSNNFFIILIVVIAFTLFVGLASDSEKTENLPALIKKVQENRSERKVAPHTLIVDK